MGLDTVELVMGVEEAFDIEIDNDDASELVTVGLLHEYVVSKLRAKGESVNSDKTYDQLTAIIIEQTGVKPSEVLPDARFVQDLKLD